MGTTEVTNAEEWWLSTSNVRALLLWMVDHDLIEDTVKAACEVLETPWSWDPEWQRMQSGDSLDEDEEGPEEEELEPQLERSVALVQARKAVANETR